MLCMPRVCVTFINIKEVTKSNLIIEPKQIFDTEKAGVAHNISKSDVAHFLYNTWSNYIDSSKRNLNCKYGEMMISITMCCPEVLVFNFKS